MAKKRKEQETADSVVDKTIVLDHIALGITKLSDGKFGVVEISYSPVSGESNVESIHEADNKAKVNELFKILAVKKGVMQ